MFGNASFQIMKEPSLNFFRSILIFYKNQTNNGFNFSYFVRMHKYVHTMKMRGKVSLNVHTDFS